MNHYQRFTASVATIKKFLDDVAAPNFHDPDMEELPRRALEMVLEIEARTLEGSPPEEIWNRVTGEMVRAAELAHAGCDENASQYIYFVVECLEVALAIASREKARRLSAGSRTARAMVRQLRKLERAVLDITQLQHEMRVLQEASLKRDQVANVVRNEILGWQPDLQLHAKEAVMETLLPALQSDRKSLERLKADLANYSQATQNDMRVMKATIQQVSETVESQQADLSSLESLRASVSSLGEIQELCRRDVASVHNELEHRTGPLMQRTNSLEVKVSRLDELHERLAEEFHAGFEPLQSAFNGEIAIAKTAKEEIEKTAGEVKKLASAYASHTASEGYSAEANGHKFEEERWKKVARQTFIIWIVVSLVLAYFPTILAGSIKFGVIGWTWVTGEVPVAVSWLTQPSGYHWSALLNRLASTLPIFLLAGFASLQTASHAKAERFLRRMQLEFAAVNPFIAPLKEESKQEVLKELAGKLFAGPHHGTDGAESRDMLALCKAYLSRIDLRAGRASR